ncbi:hypothetical protein ACFLST_01340, partial [Chloroflexota bacterium]
AEIREAITRESHSAYEIASQITWDVPGLAFKQFPPLHQRAAVTEIVAHLEYMRWEGEVTRIVEDDSAVYKTT